MQNAYIKKITKNKSLFHLYLSQITWDYATNEFGLQISFDKVNGLIIEYQ